MTASRLVAELRANGVSLRSEGARLLVEAPGGAITPDLRQQMARLKPEILLELQEEAGAHTADDRTMKAIREITCSSSAVGGIAAGAQIANTNGTLSVHNTIIAYSGTNTDAYGPITDDGYNICSDGSASLFGGSSYNYTDPKLAPLGNYGGPTLTMALPASSPAVDNGDINGCPNTDQRGYIRPFGNGPDMGAFEYGIAPATTLNVNISVKSSNATLSFSVFVAGTYYLQCSTNLINWVNLSTNGPFASQTDVSQTVSTSGMDHCFFRVLEQ